VIVDHPAQQATRYVVENVKGDLGARSVALAIADRVTVDGSADVGVRTLAADLGVHPNTIVDAVRRLEAAGHLLVERGRNGQKALYRYPQARAIPGRTARETRTVKARAKPGRSVHVDQAQSARDTRTDRARYQDGPRAKPGRSGSPSTTNTEDVAGVETTTTADRPTAGVELLEPARAALKRATRYQRQEADQAVADGRCKPGDQQKYAGGVKRRQIADLAAHQADMTEDELYALITAESPPPVLPALAAAMGQSAIGGAGTPPRPTPPSRHLALVAERERAATGADPPASPIGAESLAALLADAKAQGRTEIPHPYCPHCGADSRRRSDHFAICSPDLGVVYRTCCGTMRETMDHVRRCPDAGTL